MKYKLIGNHSLLTRKQAADYLGIKEQTLACWAHHKRYSLPYHKIGRTVKYRLEDLEIFIRSNRYELGSKHE